MRLLTEGDLDYGKWVILGLRTVDYGILAKSPVIMTP